MTRVILAHIRAIRTGHSARARIEAVDAQGLDYKLEVPTDEVRGVVGDMLVLSWTIHSNPAAVISTPATVSTAPPQATAAPDSRSVDRAFTDLMAGGRRAAGTDHSNIPFTTSVGPSGDHDIDAEFNILLGGARREG